MLKLVVIVDVNPECFQALSADKPMEAKIFSAAFIDISAIPVDGELKLLVIVEVYPVCLKITPLL